MKTSQNPAPSHPSLDVIELPAPSGTKLPTSAASSLSAKLESLRTLEREHPLWDSPLLKACRSGALSRDDFAFVFAQYHLYSRNFIRYLAALVTNCEDECGRAELIANLWEEAGESSTDERHSAVFRRFLVDGLGIDLEAVQYLDATELFVREYLTACRDGSPRTVAAFLSLGTEAIVPRMYEAFVDGLQRAGVEERYLTFFRVHIECDDGHAETLERLMTRDHTEPQWFEDVRRGMLGALDLRHRFFNKVAEALQQRRLRRLASEIALAGPASTPGCLLDSIDTLGPTIYSNTDDRAGIGFEVRRMRFASQTLDVRTLTIAPGKTNESHLHPHESVLFVVGGSGVGTVDGRRISVSAGDAMFVPRWCRHHTENTGDVPLVIFAVTDFRLTQDLFFGDAAAMTRAHPQRATDEDPALPRATGGREGA